MQTRLFSLWFLTWLACSPRTEQPGPHEEVGGAPPVPEESDPVDTGSADTGTALPDWVDAEVPEGPIPPTEGTGTEPEDGEFDWSEVGNSQLGNAFPEDPLRWDEHPRYGTAQVVTGSDSDVCVCFDLACTTCSEEPCSPETCTYDLNADHTLTKYAVELRATAYPDHAVLFEVNVSADPAISYTDIAGVLERLERIPVEYWYGLRIITEFGNGIQFLHSSYFGGSGAAAYGGMTYIDTQTVDVPTLLHELGHTYEQYTRIGNPPALEPQGNILNPIWRNAIRSDDNRTSWYGSNNEWEDLAEFARIHALCLVEGSLPALEAQSPERFRVWERILLNGSTVHP